MSTAPASVPLGRSPAPASLRQALGRFATGVTVVATADEVTGRTAGFACQSFTALSLDPPLVLFCVMKSSRTWPAVRAAGRFCITVLSGDQEELCLKFAGRGDDKFATVDWTATSSGQPRIDGGAAWFDCRLENVVEGGDHWIVIGRVEALDLDHTRSPLIFHDGSFEHLAKETRAPAVFDPFLSTFEVGSWI